MFHNSSHKFGGIAICPTRELTEYSVGQCESSAYSHSPNSSTSGIATLEDAIARLAPGGYVLDKRGLPWESVQHVISGPMEDCKLPPLTVERWGNVRCFDTYEDFLAWGEEVKAEGGNLSMCMLSLDLYAEYWRRLGAKVGRKLYLDMSSDETHIVWKEPYSGPLFDNAATLDPRLL